jgi:LmbE family N-acetylglucosaminyl deacetylase
MPKKKVPIKKPRGGSVKTRRTKAKTSRLGEIFGTPAFGKVYATIAVLTLIGTTVFWALLGARLQAGNADQLVNTYLFDNAQTFKEAIFSGQHTFLFKWPLFLLIKLFGATDGVFIVFTVLTVVLTVGVLAAVMHRLERRWLVFGTLCLALASVLLLVPAQPYAGALLPVNMAMMATRNLEYVLYIAGIALLIRSVRLRSWSFWLGTSLMALLFASDKLFLTLSVGGALLMLATYSIWHQKDLLNLALKWLAMSLVAAIAAMAILKLLNSADVTNITNQSGVSPFDIIQDSSHLLLGGTFAVLGLLTNFGANPAADIQTSILRDNPHLVWDSLTGAGGIAFLINAVIFVAGVAIAGWFIRESLKRTAKKKQADKSSKLSLILIWTSVAAVAVFIISDHHYPVDARYLTIALFATFISAAVYASKRQWRPERVALTGLVLLIGLTQGLTVATRSNFNGQSALAAIDGRNSSVAQALSRHPVDTLVGDYWRVIPIRQLADSQQPVMPLANCTTPREVLSSMVWQPDLQGRSFAYLLSLDKGLTDYPTCTPEQIVSSYGLPETSVVVAGSIDQPLELLLFYDNGLNQPDPSQIPPAVELPSTIVPITLDQLPNTICPNRSIMVFVAHQDDDILFMNPDIASAIKAGDCVRTVYLTAGDAGADETYWRSREQGAKAAYDYMDGTGSDIWKDRDVRLPDDTLLTIAEPTDRSNITLIFLRLPDGRSGRGFAATGYQSLLKLDNVDIDQIISVDGRSAYSAAQLEAALVSLMGVYQPTEIWTLPPTPITHGYVDHSDHMAVGRFVQRAAAIYDPSAAVPLKRYITYATHAMQQNVFGPALEEKEVTFLAYARFDGSVCQTPAQCDGDGAYSTYLTRQYQMTE